MPYFRVLQTHIQHKQQNHDQSRIDSFNSPVVKIVVSKGTLKILFYQNLSYEISRNNKEDIDSDKSTCKCLRPCVENYNNANRDRSKSVDIRSIACWCTVSFFYSYSSWLRNYIVLNINLSRWRAYHFMRILFRLSNLSLGNSVFHELINENIIHKTKLSP